MSSALPFDGFLAILRSRGYAVGVDGHLDVGALLRRWEQTTNAEFADAVAALLGRSEEEVLGIRRLFHETYTPRPPVVSPPPPQPPVGWGRWQRIALGAAAILAVLFLLWIRLTPRPTLPSPSPSPSIQPTAAPTVGRFEPVAAPSPNPPALPVAPRRIVRRAAVGVFGGAFLLVLAGLWANKMRVARRASVRDSWSAALGALPGPYRFPLRLPTPVLRLRRIDVEDAATILGRAISVEGLGRELDVRRSLRSTVTRGLMPTLVFKPRRRIEAVLVVQDISEGMAMWHAKVEAFLGNLRRQGIPLERWYFDGDIRRVSDKPNHVPQSFDAVMRRRPGAQVLVVSDGVGLTATLAASGNEAWLRTLRVHAKRSWLTPVSDSRLWAAELETLPINVWPMTRRGLVQSARDLAGIDARAIEHERARIVAEERVSLDDIERMKRVASLVPHPAIDLLELLRRRFTPDVSDAVIPHLLAEAGVHTAPVLRLGDEEVKRCVAMVRYETPKLEGEVRASLVEILKGSEPVPGSAAHLRWKLALSVQEIALAAANGVDATEAEASLAELSEGPLWEEVGRLVRLEQGQRAPTYGRPRSALGAGLLERVTPPESAPAGISIRIPWMRPGAREAVAALLLSGGAVLVAALLGRLPARNIPHVPDVYQLRYVAGVGTTGALEVRFSDGQNAISRPSGADLYQGDARFRSASGLARATPLSFPLDSEDTGKYYQVRGTLPRGNLGLSPWVWVPSDSLIVVLIDAQPWARVTIAPAPSQGAPASVSIGPQATPFSAALSPGTYTIRLENGGLTRDLEQQVTVTPSSPRSLRFTMPGFDPNQAAATLLGPRAR